MSSTTSTTSTSELSFRTKLINRITVTQSLLCIGLDPHESELTKYLPQDGNIEITDLLKSIAVYEYCKDIILATVDVTICYKPNIAFFEILGQYSYNTLHKVLLLIPNTIPILLDVKRGDIGSTATAYATSLFTSYNSNSNSTTDSTSSSNTSSTIDAITLSPLMGYDSIQPFIQRQYNTKGIFLLCKTSNPGSNDLLTLPVVVDESSSSSSSTTSTMVLYEKIASLVCTTWSQRMNQEEYSSSSSTTDSTVETPLLGLVVGATDPIAIQKVRTIIDTTYQSSSTINSKDNDTIWILAPGVGSQGGNLQQTIQYGINPQSGMGLIIPISRGISQSTNMKQTAINISNEIKLIRQQVMNNYHNTVKVQVPIPVPIVSSLPSTTTESTTATKSTTTTTTTQLQNYQKEFIEYCIQINVLKFGSFTLKSGRISPYFFNAGLFNNGCSLYMLGSAYAAAIMQSSQFVSDKDTINFDVIFGPAYKGIPIGAVVCTALYTQYGINVNYAYNRKEIKNHGEGGTIVGAELHNKKVLIIDDVITAGTAIREVYDILLKENAIPIGVIIALDRAEKRSLDDPLSAVQAVVRDMSIPVISIINLTELQYYMQQRTDLYSQETIQSITDYRQQYGA